MDNTAASLEDAIKELGVPPVPPMPPVGSVPDGTAPADTSSVDAVAAELTNTVPEIIPAAKPDDATATLDALMTDAPKIEEPTIAAPTIAAPTIETPSVALANAEAPAGELDEVKKSMLRDLFPIMDKVSVSPEQRFRIYHEMIENTGDKTLIAAAYEAAKGIAEDTARGEALLFLVEAADK